MDHYIDCKTMPSVIRGDRNVMRTLYNQLHVGLLQAGHARIGVSFPEHHNETSVLGTVLRLHGTKSDLEAFQALHWHEGLSDCVVFSKIAPVPENVQYRCVKRIQFKTNAERARRRLVRKKGVSIDEARRRKPDIASGVFRQYPTLCLRSTSSNRLYFVFFDHQKLVDTPVAGQFNAFGLSATTTIPWFTTGNLPS